jgi:branched-chain amino acid transport system substrate-binding protein
VKPEIRLGSIGIGSGPLGYVTQPIRDASKAWVASVNSRGGVNGHPVRLLFGDDGADPARALALAKRFVEQDKVQAMFGLHMPTTEQAIVPYLIDKRIPTVGTCNCNPASDDNPLAFNVGPGPTAGFAWEHLLSVLGQTDAKKIAVLYCREATTCDVVYKNMRQFTDKLGVEIVQGSQVSLAQPDYTAEVLAARNAGAQGIIGVVENQSAVRILRAARRQGWDVPVGSQHSVMDDRMLALPDAKGLLGAVITADYQTHPGFEEYRQAMARLPGSIKGNTGSIQWAAGLMLEKASARLGDTVTPGDIMEGLYGLRDETLGGLIPPTTYKRGVAHKEANLCAIPIVIGDGRFDFPKGPEFRCAPGWKPAQP